MTTKTPATPLPWKLHGTQVFGSLNLNGAGDYSGEGYGSQNAAYIVHAANAYPKLVERLNEILAYQPEDEKTAALLRSLGED